MRTIWLIMSGSRDGNAGHIVAYESKEDLQSALDLVRSITGADPAVTTCEVPFHECSRSADPQPEPTTTRAQIEYSPEFEAFWRMWKTKRRKDAAFDKYKSVMETLVQNKDENPQARLLALAMESQDGELAHVVLEALEKEIDGLYAT